MLCWSGLSKSGRIRNILQEFQGHHANHAYYKSGAISLVRAILLMILSLLEILLIK